MIQTEERALEAYPVDMQQLIKFDHSIEFVDANNRDRAIYRKGYEQAKKDLQEQPSEDLEKEASLYYGNDFINHNEYHSEGGTILPFAVCEAWKAGVRWQADKMQNKLIEKAVDIGYLEDWYLHSIDGTTEPIWTEKHLEELHKDFILIPKEDTI